MSQPTSDVWVQLEGVLTANPDVHSTFAIDNPLAQAADVLKFAKQFGRVYVFSRRGLSPRAQRNVQRWLTYHGLAEHVYWVAYQESAPDNAEVIQQWPTATNSTTPSVSSPTGAKTSSDSPADSPPTAS